MASVHKRFRGKNTDGKPKLCSPYWWGAWYDAAGKRVFKSTGVEIGVSKEEQRESRARAMDQVRNYERANREARAGSLTEGRAREILADILKQATGGSLRNRKTDEWLRSWLLSKSASKAETTGIRYSQAVKEFLHFLGDRAALPLSAITDRDVQAFVDARLKDNLSPSTVNVDCKVLRAAFSRAHKTGLILNDPTATVEIPARRSIERGTFTPSEVGKLVAAADGEWKTLILLGYYTAARLSECCRVDWQDVDLQKGFITFPVIKGDSRGRGMPIHPDLLTHFQSIPEPHTGPVMPHLATVRVTGRRGLSKHFLGVMEKAGIVAEKVKGAGKRELNRRSFHALRHSFTSALANHGVAPELRMKLTGHKSETVHKGYTHHELEVLRAALSQLPTVETT